MGSMSRSTVMLREDLDCWPASSFPFPWQVLSKGQPLGPAGVQVSLRNMGTDAKIQSTVTQPGGK